MFYNVHNSQRVPVPMDRQAHLELHVPFEIRHSS